MSGLEITLTVLVVLSLITNGLLRRRLLNCQKRLDGESEFKTMNAGAGAAAAIEARDRHVAELETQVRKASTDFQSVKRKGDSAAIAKAKKANGKRANRKG